MLIDKWLITLTCHRWLDANLIGCHVEGQLEKNINWAEVDVVKTLIEELLAAGYCLNSADSSNTIGVISPYHRQVNTLTQCLQSRWPDFSSQSIGIVHTFQDGHKSVIIFSTRQCPTPNTSLLRLRQRQRSVQVPNTQYPITK